MSQVKDSLRTRIQSTEEFSPSSERRIRNIIFIENFSESQEGLSSDEREVQLLIHETVFGEKICIQHPGKESRTHRKDGKPVKRQDKIRPWDFKPIVLFTDTKEYLPDLGFSDMWRIITVALDSVENRMARKLVTLFYRMALIEDNIRASSPLRARNVKIEDKQTIPETDFIDTEVYGWFYRYQPPRVVLDSLTVLHERMVSYIDEERKVPITRGFSLEAFLYYAELLSWNEDCKYYYRNREHENGEWLTNTGRLNNLLTHISFIGCLLGELPLYAFAKKFAGTRSGVSPLDYNELIRIMGDFVVQ